MEEEEEEVGVEDAAEEEVGGRKEWRMPSRSWESWRRGVVGSVVGGGWWVVVVVVVVVAVVAVECDGGMEGGGWIGLFGRKYRGGVPNVVGLEG